MKYRSKIVEIEAFRFQPKTGEYFRDMPPWLEVAYETDGVGGVDNVGSDVNSSVLQISTLEGTMTAQQGDWIIRGTEGELYPCKPSVFERKYEPA